LVSPTSGMVEQIEEAGRRGARIVTSDCKLYSPSAGRVLSIAPRGNSFLIMTDWGSEVEVRACTSEDDLLDRYFRPRVIRGEIIRRGKLLLEYDREKLDRECEDTAVYLMAEQTGEMEPSGESQVEMGEALFWVN
ncbi:MAG: PTS glucose transporter subunit IIA, partial [Lachnospiraceae bacterium]|nr:PTS glucose transporter subunit IIA [Lachnospiraceae bacterium]